MSCQNQFFAIEAPGIRQYRDSEQLKMLCQLTTFDINFQKQSLITKKNLNSFIKTCEGLSGYACKVIDIDGHKVNTLAQVRPEQTFSVRITLNENVLDYIMQLYLKRMIKLTDNDSKYTNVLTNFKPWCVQSKALFEVINQLLHLRPIRTLVDDNSIEYVASQDKQLDDRLSQNYCYVEARLLEKYGYMITYARKDGLPSGPSYVSARAAYASLDPQLGFRFLNLNARVNSKHYKHYVVEEPVESRVKQQESTDETEEEYDDYYEEEVAEIESTESSDEYDDSS